MICDRKTYEKLVAMVRVLDPLLIDAIDECDEALMEEFGSLSIEEKIRWASEGAESLAALKAQ